MTFNNIVNIQGNARRLYLALIAGDYSGDLRYESEKFFAALQDGWKYDKSFVLVKTFSKGSFTDS
jgi:hypothetical protein